ncbi:MAG: tRNA (adenosine(37)-N6)-threonylcarbamoyltransferase complex dimerization subunit type 1 TsaB [Actinobacteria bacterium]|nr:tRNA (adenosine(37)-N6)-threonylcarbamoyltransferase complex dimerization subunit type 1 TsaB [Actinomycetota bacterium]
MNLLGIDTSTPASAACLLRADGEAFEVVPDVAELTAPPGHARELMPRIATVLDRAGVRATELEAIAVGTGPGGFTGLRIGIATARGLASAAGAGLVPVSSLDALAAGIDAAVRVPLIDARRGELFGAILSAGESHGEPFVAPPETVAERAAAAGSSGLAAGDGSLRFRGLLEAAGVKVADEGSSAHVVRALNVCRLADGARPVAPEAVLPNYIRAPDARPHS